MPAAQMQKCINSLPADAADNARSNEVASDLLRKQLGPNHTAMLILFRSAWALINFPAANQEEKVHLLARLCPQRRSQDVILGKVR